MSESTNGLYAGCLPLLLALIPTDGPHHFCCRTSLRPDFERRPQCRSESDDVERMVAPRIAAFRYSQVSETQEHLLSAAVSENTRVAHDLPTDDRQDRPD